MGAQKQLLKAGSSILALAGAIGNLKKKFSEAGKAKAKKQYSEETNKIAENKRLIAERKALLENKKLDLEEKQLGLKEKDLKIKERNLRTKDKISKEKARQAKEKLAGVKQPAANEKAEAKPVKQEPGRFEFPEDVVSSETNIDANNPDVAGLLKAKEIADKRNTGYGWDEFLAERKEAAIGQENVEPAAKPKSKSQAQKAYRQAEADANTMVGGKKDDIWVAIGLDPNITDEDIKKAGLTKTEIMKQFASYSQYGDEWADEWNKKMAKEGKNDLVMATAGDDYVKNQAEYSFGRTLSAYINYDKTKAEMEKREQEYWDNKEAEEPQEKKYFVWGPDDEEEDEDYSDIDRGSLVF